MLYQVQYHVCSFYLSIQVTLRLISIDRIHSRELHVPEMGLMSSSKSSSMETKDTTIWIFSGRLERRACWALTTLVLCLWNLSLKILFSVYSPWLGERCAMPSATGRTIPLETLLIWFCKCWRLNFYLSSCLYLFKGTWIYSRLKYCPSCEYSSPFYWSFR